ncbi:hypothetical protein C882_1841 [Caenispirillum salinarum AK4]|uniref:Uncharacterized protein n=1 Tax=Caenispirillum salinarum AK4 TaxID=1238182 RepID=K9GRH2_9PROT|nr:hypothetical protein C882_1841 [Caenispirillum salinarum AK4]
MGASWRGPKSTTFKKLDKPSVRLRSRSIHPQTGGSTRHFGLGKRCGDSLKY